MRPSRSPGATLVLGLFLLASVPSVGSAEEYSFTELLDDQGIGSFDPYLMAMNDSGVAALRVVLADSTEAILRVDGASVTTIADTTGTFVGFAAGSTLDINDAGTVAFNGHVLVDQTARGGVFAGNGGPVITLGPVPQTILDPSYSLFSLGNDGLALIGKGPIGQPPDTVVTSDGGLITTVYDSMAFPDEDIPGTGAYGIGDLNDGGELALVAGPATGLWWFVYKGNTAGGALNRVASPALTDPNSPTFGFVALNNQATVAVPVGDFGGFQALYVGSEEPLDAAVTTDDPYSFFGYGGVGINDSGSLTFQAWLDAGGQGIFTGPDPVADKVIATGDPLDGSTVEIVETNRFCLNNFGQLAFYVLLADGRQGIFRATPASFLFADGFESGDTSAW